MADLIEPDNLVKVEDFDEAGDPRSVRARDQCSP